MFHLTDSKKASSHFKTEGPTSARKAVVVTLWISYTLLCVHTSAFITRGRRGPAYFAMELGKEVPKGRSWLTTAQDQLLCSRGALYLPVTWLEP